jgi:hypothetical protein
MRFQIVPDLSKLMQDQVKSLLVLVILVLQPLGHTLDHPVRCVEQFNQVAFALVPGGIDGHDEEPPASMVAQVLG